MLMERKIKCYLTLTLLIYCLTYLRQLIFHFDVKSSGKMEESVKEPCRVPQGSVLGLL